MTVRELKTVLAALDDVLEIEIIAVYEDDDGDEIERSFNLESVAAVMDSDTAREYARFDAVEPV